MAYLHCHNCDWSQDDFWDEKGYNPISTLKDDIEYLFRDKVYFDGSIKDSLKKYGNIELKEDENGHYITGKEYVIHEMERSIARIKHMVWTTNAEFEKDYKDGIAKCPKCKCKNEFDIDQLSALMLAVNGWWYGQLGIRYQQPTNLIQT